MSDPQPDPENICRRCLGNGFVMAFGEACSCPRCLGTGRESDAVALVLADDPDLKAFNE